MPETVDHHLRQYVRWMRGAFIRSWWRIRYLPLSGYAFWAHALGWVQMVVSTTILGLLFVAAPIRDPRLVAQLPFLLTIPVLIGYGQALRFLSVRRNDDRLRSQLLTFALAPVATLWAFTVLRVVRWYAMVTCLKTGWGTRENVEVAVSYGGGEDTVPLSKQMLRDRVAGVPAQRTPALERVRG
jgi:hyaluronan synthase